MNAGLRDKMIKSVNTPIALCRRFIGSERGSASIEAAIWIPIYMGLLLLIANTSLVFYGQSQAMRIVQDGNRALSVGRLTTEAETVEFITQRLIGLTDNPVVETVLNEGIVYTSVRIPVEDLAQIGNLEMFTGYNVTVASQMFVEY